MFYKNHHHACYINHVQQNALCDTGYNNFCFILTLPIRYVMFVLQSQSLKIYFQDSYFLLYKGRLFT